MLAPVDGGGDRRTSARRSVFGDDVAAGSGDPAAAIEERREVGASARATRAAAPAKERARRWANARMCLLVALIVLAGGLVWWHANGWRYTTERVTLDLRCIAVRWTDDRTGITWLGSVPVDMTAPPDPPKADPAPAPRADDDGTAGTMSFLDQDHAQFTTDGGEVVTLVPYAGPAVPLCRT
jgi:hypothetical protein